MQLVFGLRKVLRSPKSEESRKKKNCFDLYRSVSISFLNRIFVLYPSQGTFHPVAVFFFLPMQLVFGLRKVLSSPKSEESRKKKLVHLYRNTSVTAPYRGKPAYSSHVMRAIPQSRQAILTAICRDTALYGDAALLGDPCCSTF